LNNYQTDPSSSTAERISLSWVEKKGFAHWGLALLWLLLMFLLSQIIVAVVAVVYLLVTGEATTVQELLSAVNSRLDVLFLGNSAGQILCFALATLLITRLHTASESKRSFLRMTWTSHTPRYMLLAIPLILVIQPTIMFLGYLNSFLPVPDIMAEMQQNQYQMFEDFLRQDGVLLLGLFHIALVPAFAEEILFRGYIFRAFEKSKGVIGGLIFSSLIFALFHLQLTNILPLATLGAVMGLLTWVSGSIWPAVVAHFINNGSAVVVGSYMPDTAFADLTPETLPSLWMLGLSIILTAVLVRIILYNSNYQLKE
jgi:membrane protease YdiL (CAAX protease family)